MGGTMNARILTFDDEPAVGRAVRRVLAGAGFEVTVATDLKAARTALAGGEFAVIIADERMPETSGVEFLEECAAEHPMASRVLLTGYADPQTAAEAIRRAEIIRLLFKPWNQEELITTAREAAWRHSLLAAGEVEQPNTAPFGPLVVMHGGK